MEDSIRHLILDDLTWLGDAGLEAIGKLPVVKQLTTLHINNMPITMKGLRAVVRYIEELEQFGGTSYSRSQRTIGWSSSPWFLT